MPRPILLLLAIGALGAGCTDFNPIDRGVCGNGLLEPGEDCDSAEAACVRCALTCSTTADCPTDGGFACGVDHTCHASSGLLGTPVEGDAFPVSSLTVSDVDHDGIGDALGVSSSSIVVRHGATTANLSRTTSVVTPQQVSLPGFGDLDSDGATDVAVTTPDGIVAYTSRFGTLSPASVNTSYVGGDGAILDVRQLFALTSDAFAILAADRDGKLFLGVTDGNPANDIVTLPCNRAIPATEASRASFDLYRAGPDPSTGEVHASDLVLALSAGPVFCALSLHKGAFTAAEVYDITPSSASLDHRAFFARLDSDADECPDLVNADGGAAHPRVWRGGRGGLTNHCVLTPTLSPQGADLPALGGSPGAALVGHVPIAPALAFIATDALATTDGISLVGTGLLDGSVLAFYRSARPITRIESGDFNGDGLGDALVQSGDADDLDIIFRTDAPLGALPWRVDTTGVVGALAVADYDGNRVTDIAYAEQTTDAERLMVSFGTTDRPLPSTQVAVFDTITDLIPLGLPDSIDQSNQATDLLVVERGAMGTVPHYAAFHGSPQRTLITYIDPRTDQENADGYAPIAGGIGHFSDSGRSGIFGAIALGTGAPAKLFAVPADGAVLDDAHRAAILAPGLMKCDPLSAAPPGGALCANSALLLAWPTASGRDVAIGIDHAATPRAAVVRASGGTSPTADVTPIASLASYLTPGTVPASLHALPAGTAPADLLVTLRSARAGTNAVLVCAVDPQGMPGACTDLLPTIAATVPGAQCGDATPLGTAVVASCASEAGAVLVALEREGAAWSAHVIAPLPVPLRLLRAGDVTGDGVPDLVGVTINDTLLVAPQCTTRDLTCGHVEVKP